LPVVEWPEADRIAWDGACRPANLLEDAGLAAGWRLTTRESAARSWGRFLTFLASHDLLDPSAPISARITPTTIRTYVADLEANGNATGTIHIRVLHLCRMLDVMAPGTRPAWLGRLLAKLRAAIRPTRDDRARLVPAARLVALGRSLMEQAETSTFSPRLKAVAYRDGLMIMILLASALRVGNLAALKLGHSFVRRGEGWWLTFEPNETKNRRRIDMPLPGELTPMIERYLDMWRPILLQRPPRTKLVAVDSGLLWLGRYGGAFGPKKIAKRFAEVTLRSLGHSMHPHLVRKLVATELAIHDPTHVGVAQALLTHATYDTTQKAYNLAQSLDAARRIQATVVSVRQAVSAKVNPA
jgi:integrase